MERFHPLHPILSRAAIWAMHEKLAVDRQPNQEHAGTHDEQIKLRMVYALGAVWAYRQGVYAQHPFGHFTAALQILITSGFCFASPEDVQNFLLIARFGMFYYIGVYRHGRRWCIVVIHLDETNGASRLFHLGAGSNVFEDSC